VIAGEIFGDGRRHHRHLWPAGVGEALMMLDDGFGSRRERRKRNLVSCFEKKGD